jgi:hypothetical protein
MNKVFDFFVGQGMFDNQKIIFRVGKIVFNKLRSPQQSRVHTEKDEHPCTETGDKQS